MKTRKLVSGIVLSSVLVASALFPTVSHASTQTASYTIQKRDTLSSISQKYHTTVSMLKQLNHLHSDIIYAGRKLLVPVSNSKPVVQPVSKPVAQPVSKPAITHSSVPVNKPASPIHTASPASSVLKKEVLGFSFQINSSDMSSYNSIMAHPNYLSSIATVTHSVDGNGNVTGTVPSSELTFAVSKGIKPTLLIGNGFSSSVSKSLLESYAHRQNMVRNTLNILKTYGYKGVNIDIENIPSWDRNNYTALIQEMASAIKPYGYTLSVSVSAKTQDTPKIPWEYGYDYRSLGKYADFLVIMAYDYHYAGSQPGAVAPYDWVSNVVNFAISTVPRNKIVLGIPSYGYDWGKGVATKGYGMNTMVNLANAHHATIVFDNVAKTPHFSYRDASGVYHQVWFENAQSLAYKFDLVNRYGLKGIADWRLGLENNDFWNLVKSKFE